MNIDSLSDKLNKIQNELNNEINKLKNITKNLNEQSFNDPINEHIAKQYYYSYLNDNDKQYLIKNDQYKKLISQFSLPYLELCEWYVGPELPKPIHQTFLDSKEDINSLYFLFMMSLFLK